MGDGLRTLQEKVRELELFNRGKLKLKPLRERIHDLDWRTILPLQVVPVRNESISMVAGKVKEARKRGGEVILMMGGHVVRSGVQKYLIDLLEERYITCLAMNGSCVIHDFEMAMIGATTESVARYIKEGQFGLWEETARINDIVNGGFKDGAQGLGAAVGKAISEGDFPFKDVSLLAACHRAGVPATVHVGIGCDILHEHPNFDGAATGGMSYRDFLVFTQAVANLEGGVFMNFGSAVTGPEVFLKALSMARNVAHQEGRTISSFSTAVFDLVDLPACFSSEAPKDEPGYYFRPWKTLLVRTIADGGSGYYVRGRHRETLPALWSAIKHADGEE